MLGDAIDEHLDDSNDPVDDLMDDPANNPMDDPARYTITAIPVAGEVGYGSWVAEPEPPPPAKPWVVLLIPSDERYSMRMWGKWGKLTRRETEAQRYETYEGAIEACNKRDYRHPKKSINYNPRPLNLDDPFIDLTPFRTPKIEASFSC